MTTDNTPLNSLLQKEVSRREFLTLALLAVGSVFGFGGIIKLLTGKSIASSRLTTTGAVGAYGNKGLPRK